MTDPIKAGRASKAPSSEQLGHRTPSTKRHAGQVGSDFKASRVLGVRIVGDDPAGPPRHTPRHRQLSPSGPSLSSKQSEPPPSQENVEQWSDLTVHQSGHDGLWRKYQGLATPLNSMSSDGDGMMFDLGAAIGDFDDPVSNAENAPEPEYHALTTNKKVQLTEMTKIKAIRWILFRLSVLRHGTLELLKYCGDDLVRTGCLTSEQRELMEAMPAVYTDAVKSICGSRGYNNLDQCFLGLQDSSLLNVCEDEAQQIFKDKDEAYHQFANTCE